MATLTSDTGGNVTPPLRVLIVMGTRPEGVKLFPLHDLLRVDPRFHVALATTGQHRELLDDVLAPLGVVPDMDLHLMEPEQPMNVLVSRALAALDRLYLDWRPDTVLVQGDTSSAFCAALAAFQCSPRVLIGHVEAGLRTFDRLAPYPEEVNRRMISVVADFHFAPTKLAALHLQREGIARERVIVTGNTVVDAVRRASVHGAADGCGAARLAARERRAVFVSLHRREAWLSGVAADSTGSFIGALEAVRAVAQSFPSVDFVYRTHPNPVLLGTVSRSLGGIPNVQIIEPIRSYPAFIALLRGMDLILTDSGGLQEEAQILGIPVLIARDNTERPEALEIGGSLLVGTQQGAIRSALMTYIENLLRAGPAARRESYNTSPFGDGLASERIRDALLYFTGRESQRPHDLQVG